MKLDWMKLLYSQSEVPREPKRENDERSPFDSDYSRITFSAPFRRLQDKTQVFPLEKNDFVRTRLTHSIEVASIARSLGKSISKKLSEKYLNKEPNKYNWSEDCEKNIPTILECAGLIHDIGNPPFGHSSEKAIQNWFKNREKKLKQELVDDVMCKDFLNFDGNVQGFRILTHLQCIYDYSGYHLTNALLAATMKYPVDSDHGNKGDKGDRKYKKFGYFYAEKENAKNILEKCGLVDEDGNTYRSPLAIILEAADDIAYSAADVEDGFKKGLFNLEDLLQELKQFESDDCVKKVLEKANKHNEKISLEERKIQWLRISIHQVYCDTVVEEFIDNYDDIMTGNFKDELLKYGKLKKLREILEKFSLDKLIDQQDVAKLEIAGKNVINFLLEQFSKNLLEPINKMVDNAEECLCIDKCMEELKKTRVWFIISEDFKDIFEHTVDGLAKNNKVPKNIILYYLYLLITDFISGMTDNYCIRLYRHLTGIDIHN